IAFPNGIYGMIEHLLGRSSIGAGWPTLARLRLRAPATPAAAGNADPGESRPAAPRPRTAGAEVLVAEAVTVTFGGVRALESVSLSVREGTIHALVGPNGAGKTTFLNCVTGLQRATGGRILVDGREVSRSPAHAVRSRGVSRTFQSPSL